MHNAKRLGLAMLLLSAAFLVLVGVAATALWAAGQATTAFVLAVIGVACAAAGAITWRVASEEEADLPEEAPEAETVPAPTARKPVRIQTMPVADLPLAYVEAVMKGAHARSSAFKAQSSHSALGGK
jgi:hypothetical protein